MLSKRSMLMFETRLSLAGWRVIADQSAAALSVYPLRL